MKRKIHSLLCPFLLLCLWSITHKYTHMQSHTHNPCVLFFKHFLHKIFDRLLQNEVGWNLKTERVWQEQKGERETGSQRGGREGEGWREQVYSCHCLYPPATSLILALEDRNTEGKQQKGRRCIIKPLFCSRHLSLFLFLFLTHSLTLPPLCDDLQSNRKMTKK